MNKVKKQAGWLTIGFCLKVLLLAGIIGGGAYYTYEQIAMRWAIPDLQLSAVYHGDQLTWCYEFKGADADADKSCGRRGFSSPPLEESERSRAFSSFVQHDLAKFATQISYIHQTNQIHVTWQATPHNQCQFVFTGEESGVKVQRRKFSACPTLVGENHAYSVKETLDASDVSADPQPLEDIGYVQGVSFDALKTGLGITQEASSEGVSAEQQAFIRGVFSPPQASQQPVEGAATSSVRASMMEWMYGERSTEIQDMYRERRD